MTPCLDSEEMGGARRRELDIRRDDAKELGQSAVSAAKNGFYINRAGEKVYWRQLVETTCASKRSIPSEERLPDGKSRVFSETRVQVTNDKTIGAAHRSRPPAAGAELHQRHSFRRRFS
jgi:hypothetical protein